MPPKLSLAQARRICLAAQGFGLRTPESRDAGQGPSPGPGGQGGRPPRSNAVTTRDLQRVVDRVAQFQIDSINVVARAQYLPLYSRLGPYDTGLLDRAAHRAPRRLFEYWGHAASLVDVQLQPALRWRMAAARDEAWGGIVRLSREHPGVVDKVYAEIAARGPITARQIEHEEERRRDNWGWNWSAVKTACEWLLWSGQITSAGRNSQFERRYAVPERVLPAAVAAAPTPERAEAMVILARRAARALGIVSLRCLRDYFRTSVADSRPAIEHLVATGELEPVEVPGWRGPLWLWHEARRPRTVRARALLSPFDSLVFERTRLQSLFGVDYRIEIYVPEAQRRFGYYSYVFLTDEAIVARVDLKADRAAGVLRVRSAWRDPSVPQALPDAAIVADLSAELVAMAGWLGLGEISVEERGDLADALRRGPLAA